MARPSAFDFLVPSGKKLLRFGGAHRAGALRQWRRRVEAPGAVQRLLCGVVRTARGIKPWMCLPVAIPNL